MNERKEYTEKVFEDIKHIDENGNEYWYARELQKILGYRQWRSINNLIERARVACEESKYNVYDHFAVHRKMIKLAKGATRNVIDYKLSRYVCYLIVMNGNPKKEIIALGQTYFAIQTRKQELSEKEYNKLTEDEKKLYRRNQARKGVRYELLFPNSILIRSKNNMSVDNDEVLYELILENISTFIKELDTGYFL